MPETLEAIKTSQPRTNLYKANCGVPVFRAPSRNRKEGLVLDFHPKPKGGPDEGPLADPPSGFAGTWTRDEFTRFITAFRYELVTNLNWKFKNEFVYFMSDDAGNVKIGFSKCPERRRSELAFKRDMQCIDPPGDIDILGYFNATRTVEDYLHRQFDSDRVSWGEWFYRSANLLRLITEISIPGSGDGVSA